MEKSALLAAHIKIEYLNCCPGAVARAGGQGDGGPKAAKLSKRWLSLKQKTLLIVRLQGFLDDFVIPLGFEPRTTTLKV